MGSDFLSKGGNLLCERENALEALDDTFQAESLSRHAYIAMAFGLWGMKHTGSLTAGRTTYERIYENSHFSMHLFVLL